MFVFVSVCCFVCAGVWVFSMRNCRCIALNMRSTRRRIRLLHNLRFRIVRVCVRMSVCCFVCVRVWVFSITKLPHSAEQASFLYTYSDISMTNYRCLDKMSTRRRMRLLYCHLRFRIGGSRWHHKQRLPCLIPCLRTPWNYMCILYMCVCVCIYGHRR